MKFHLKSILLILGFFLFIENPLISAEFDITDFNTAKTVANNILLINRDNKTLLEHGLDTIMKDHSLSHHATGDSYLMTDDINQMRNLINFVVSYPDFSESYTRSGRNRLTVRKTISQNDSFSIFNTNHIGYDDRYKIDRDHVILCFDVTGIKTLSDSTKNGGFITAFSARQNYKSN